MIDTGTESLDRRQAGRRLLSMDGHPLHAPDVNWFFTERLLGLCASSVASGHGFAFARLLVRHAYYLGDQARHARNFTRISLAGKFAPSGVLAPASGYPIFTAARAVLASGRAAPSSM